MPTKDPFISIILVNYHGRQLLADNLPSVLDQTYPHSRYEVIVVDNNSGDDSVSVVQKNFPSVKVISLDSNRGFTGGNQAGYDQAKGEYIVLLNTDVSVERTWLAELVKAAKPKNVGLVASRLRFATPYLKLEISTTPIMRSEIEKSIDFSPLGIIIENVYPHRSNLSSQVWYHQGFYKQDEGEITTRWTKESASILVPITADEETYTMTFHGYPTADKLSTPVQVKVGDKVLVDAVISSNQSRQFTLSLDKKTFGTHLTWLIQNAGNAVLHDGYSKDRGNVLRNLPHEKSETYEIESPYFDEPRNLLAVCGASCLLKRSMIEDVGFLDGHYFMYYEDVDLSLRAWRGGWDIAYAPDSIGYHAHRATTGREESLFFLSTVEKNHLALVITHFPLHTVLSEVLLFLVRLSLSATKTFVFQFRDNVDRTKLWKMRTQARILAVTMLVKQLPSLHTNRKYWQEHQQRGFGEMKKLMY